MEIAAISSPKEKATALQGWWNSKVNKHSPVFTFQSFVLLSADAVMSFDESTAKVEKHLFIYSEGPSHLPITFTFESKSKAIKQ